MHTKLYFYFMKNILKQVQHCTSSRISCKRVENVEILLVQRCPTTPNITVSNLKKYLNCNEIFEGKRRKLELVIRDMVFLYLRKTLLMNKLFSFPFTFHWIENGRTVRMIFYWLIESVCVRAQIVFPLNCEGILLIHLMIKSLRI